MPYAQLSMDERYMICHMHMAGFTASQIADRLGRHRGTIGRELKRNACLYAAEREDPVRYFYDTAQRLCEERRRRASCRYKLDDSELGHFVAEKLLLRWSPQQIVGRLGRDHRRDPAMRVTPETIYRWVYRRATMGESWYERLRRRRKRRKRRIPGQRGAQGQIPGRVGIEHRPAVVDRRQRYGDWESDTVEGAKGRGLLATHVERKSRYLLVRKLENKRAKTFNRATLAAFKTMPPKLRRTLTADNGKEFAAFATLERRLGIDVYFANPHALWERGASFPHLSTCFVLQSRFADKHCSNLV